MNEHPIRVLDMTESEFEAYLERTLPIYAAEGAKATGMEPEAALEKAREQFAAILPDGCDTPGQYFKSVSLPSGERVGVLWYALPPDASSACLFLYDIVVEEAVRGRGLGTACMHWLEAEGRRLGASEIGLHVFTKNAGAIRLYEGLGFVPTQKGDGGMQMKKPLPRAGG